MYSNGPTKNVQPLPAATSGYENIAPYAKITATNVAEGSKTEWLNDKLIAHSDDDLVKEFSTVDGPYATEITLEFDDYVTARAIMIYNSYDYEKAFEKVMVKFHYRKEIDGQIYTGEAVIEDLKFDFESNFIPEDYLKYKAEKNYDQLRPCSAAIAEFNEIEIDKIVVYVYPKLFEEQENVNISEIVILGKAESK
jgi:hypothetical protein